MITVLIPAHNEADGIAATIRGLQEQTVQPDRIIVVADNCTDATVSIAESLGVEVFETVGNTHKKAGALNQALTLVETSLLLVMDADTVLVKGWIETAIAELKNPDVAAVGAVFYADSDRGWLRGCQAREWARYSEEIDRVGKTFVLSGTAALIRTEALREVGGYDENSITEDFRLTVDLLGAGWKLRSPVACESVTETMPTVKSLFLQRRRWSLGALQTVSRAGWKPHTRAYWWQQVMLTIAVLCMSLFLLMTAVVVINGWFALTWVSIIVTAIFAVERVVTVWDMSVRHRAVAAILIPEIAYALILQAAYVAAVWQFVTGQSGTWHHVERKEA